MLACRSSGLPSASRVDRYRLAVAPETPRRPPPRARRSFSCSHTLLYYGGSQSEKAKDDGMPSGSSKKRPTSNKKKRQQQRGDTKKQPRQKIPSLEEILAKAEASLEASDVETAHSLLHMPPTCSEVGWMERRRLALQALRLRQ